MNPNKNKNKLSMFNYLDIAEIRDDSVILRDGSVSCVLNVKPINLARVNYDKRLVIQSHFRNWLSTLTYPVQIVARTINADSKEIEAIFRTKTEHQIKEKPNYKNTLRAFREFSDWLASYIDMNCIAGRLFYIVITHKPLYLKESDAKNKADYRKSLKILEQRARQAKELLEKTGVKIRRLTNTDLENIYSSYFTMFLQLNKTKNSRYLPSKRWLDMWKMEVIENGTS